MADMATGHAAKEAAVRGEQYLGFSEATYVNASFILYGHGMRRGMR